MRSKVGPMPVRANSNPASIRYGIEAQQPRFMKDFMLIFLGQDYAALDLSPEQIQARMGKWFAWAEKMKAQGLINKGEALHSPVRRVSGPDRIVTDQPGSEIKELIGGYYIVRVADADAAVEVAQDFPDYDLGSTVEIREVVVFDGM